MQSSIFGFLSILIILSVLVFGRYFPRKSSFEDVIFDEDGSIASGVELQPKASRSRLLKEEDMRKEIDSAYKEAVKSQSISEALRAFDSVTIPAIVHIVKDEDESNINEAEGKEQEQIDVLNNAFIDNDMGFTFELKAIRTHVSSKFWNEPCPRCKGYDSTSPMAKSTREGDGDTLNIWFNNGPPFGFAMMGSPFGYDDFMDGVVVKHTTIYGGSNERKNLGTLLVHEVGHWLGLDHTFSGYSCSGDGDGVSDTAPQKNPTHTCSSEISEVDTCPDDDFPDPVHNYMNYVDDPCMHSFTPGQALKSHLTWEMARAEGTRLYTSSPTQRPIPSLPTSQYTPYPTRGLRNRDRDRDRDRIREDILRTRRPLDISLEDTINCPAVWPGDGAVCVMIDGFSRKKCIYYEYGADSICTCSLSDPFWTCVNGPDLTDDDFTNIDIGNSEDMSNVTVDIESIPDIDSIFDLGINTNGETTPADEETSDLSLTENTADETPDETPALSLLGGGDTLDRIP